MTKYMVFLYKKKMPVCFLSKSQNGVDPARRRHRDELERVRKIIVRTWSIEKVHFH